MKKDRPALRFPQALLSGIAALAGTVCIAATPQPSLSIDADALRTHVEYLASDALEGRAPGTPGFAMAADYVARQFEQVGLKPAGDEGGWFQKVPLLEAYADVPGGAMRLQRGSTVVDLEPKTDFLPRAQFVESDASVTAPAVFVGHGIHAPQLEYNDFSNVEVRGRIAVIIGGAPARFPHNERAYFSSTVYKYSTLAERGAVGVIFMDTPVEEKRRPWSRAVLQSWMPSMRWQDENGAPFEAFPELRGKFILSRDGARKLFEGAPKTLEHVFARARSGRDQGFALPVTVTLGSKTRIGSISSVNVVGVLEGSDPVLKSEYVVYTAHLDHIGKGAPVNGDGIYNGALDNASGIAIMIEMARTLAAMPQRPRRSMIFLAVTAEERGLLGSDYFARRPTVPARGLIANINMDMPVAFTELRDFVAFGAEHSSLGPVVARAARREGMQLSADPTPEEVSFVRSDQYSFVRQGVPALDLNPGVHARHRGIDAAAQAEDFLQNRYHMPGDDISQPIHFETLARLGRVNARIGVEVANADEPPRWVRRDFFGEQFGLPRAAALAARARAEP